jgi:transcription elongation factor SPT5
MGGQYTGHTGRVVAMTSSDGDPVAVVLSDGSKTEMYCNVSLLQVSNEVAHGRSTLGGYQKDDLVQLNENEVGMIIDVGLEALRIITQLEIVKDIHPNEIRMNMNQISQRTKFFDAEQKQFGTGDTLKVVSGNHEKSTGIVRHVYKGTVWLHSDNYLKNSGVMVVKARFCLLIGSLHAGRPSTLSAAAPVHSASATGRNSLASTPNSTVSRQSGSAGQPGGRGGGPGGRFAKDPLIGKTVRIMKGPYRGLSAQVINGSGGFYQVELLAKMKKVTVPASTFVEEGDERGRSKPVVPGDSSVRSQSFDSQSFGSMTPYTGMQTPAYIGSETPRVGSETPSHYNVMFTPHRPEDTDSSSWGDAMDLDISNYGTPQHGQGHASIAGTPASDTSAATPTSLGVKTSEDVDTWVENMIVMVKAGPEMGRLAVIKRIRHDGTVTLQQRDGMGALINAEFTLPVSSVKPPDKPTAGGIVKILSGNHAGALGTVKMAMKGQVVITVNGSTETFKATSILWLNSVSGK